MKNKKMANILYLRLHRLLVRGQCPPEFTRRRQEKENKGEKGTPCCFDSQNKTPGASQGYAGIFKP
jgi:hypothetical protein